MQFKNLEYFSRGKRSKVYTASYKKRKVIVKYTNRSLIESYWLKKLSKLSFVPRLIYADKNTIVYEFVGGKPILNHLNKIKNPRTIIKQIFRQCYELDKLGINKKELTNPYKHILIKNQKARMIDFERCHETKKPKNVTQFSQYILSKRISSLLKEKEIIVDKNKFVRALKNYKINQTRANFLKILELI